MAIQQFMKVFYCTSRQCQRETVHSCADDGIWLGRVCNECDRRRAQDTILYNEIPARYRVDNMERWKGRAV